MFGLEYAKNTNPKSQTHTQREGEREREREREREIYELRYVLEAEERDLLMIYTRYKRITIGSLTNSHQKINLPKMCYILYL